MNIIKIYNYVCSLGTVCFSNCLMQKMNLKFVSYPFDWIISSPEMITHCLESDFSVFLDKQYYVDIGDRVCGHTYYTFDNIFKEHNPLAKRQDWENIFRHRNLLKHEEDYEYFVRCVDRFKKLLKEKGAKLFIMSWVHLPHDINGVTKLKNNVIEFNNKFKNYVDDYHILCIFQYSNRSTRSYEFENIENIDFLEVHTIENKKYDFFLDDDNYAFICEIIKNHYAFDVGIRN